MKVRKIAFIFSFLLSALSFSACTTVKLDPNFSSARGFGSLFGAGSFMHIRAESKTSESELSESVRAYTASGYRNAVLRVKACALQAHADMRI
jgi:hypothetical protein